MIELEEKRSFESVNYMFRPKKQIERKIIIEILQELNKEVDLSKYKYVGFGSIYYYDFILFHKFLNLNNLLSIDNKSTRKRFKFNRPYDFISFKNKISTDFLSEFAWQQNVVLWLDYDHKLSDVVVSDLRIIANNCSDGDILIVTLDASCEDASSEESRRRRDKSREEFYSDFGTYISPEYKVNEGKKYFTPKFLPMLLQNVTVNYLGAMCEYRDIKFYKLFSFSYQDTSPMFTIGGIFDSTGELSDKDWDNDFISNDEDIRDIDVPILTYCEKFYIDSNIRKLKRKINELENSTRKYSDFLKRKRIMTEKINKVLPFELSFYDLKKYIDYYRYYPQYYEGIV